MIYMRSAVRVEEMPMNDRELKKMSRGELVSLLLEEKRKNEALSAEADELRRLLGDRSLAIERSGSMAEAALALNGVFDAADAACRQYAENVEALTARRNEEAKRGAEEVLREAKRGSEAILAEAKRQGEALLREAKRRSEE